MKRRLFWMWVVFAGVFAAKLASAEVVEGMVTYVDPVNRMIGIREMLERKSSSDPRVLAFTKDLKTLNIGSVDEIKPGDMVRMNARKAESPRILEADAIRRTGSVAEIR